MGKFNYWQKFQENSYYHIYNRGINGTNIFKYNENYKFLLRKWKMLIHPFFDTLGYCLMPNHFHFLVLVKPLTVEIKECIEEIETSKSRNLIANNICYNDFLEDQFKRLFSSYALAFNKQERRTGSLFQKRFKRVGIQNGFESLEKLAYIHHNPIHHSFTSNYDEWSFSSYPEFINDSSSIVDSEAVFDMFDVDEEKARRAFIEFHEVYKNKRMLQS